MYMSFKRRAQLNKTNHSLQGGVDCVTFLPGRGGSPQDRWGDSLSCIVCQSTSNPLRDCITRLRGGAKLAWCKVSSLIASSIAVYKFSSLAEFIEDDCKIISSLYMGRIKVGAIPKGGLPC